MSAKIPRTTRPSSASQITPIPIIIMGFCIIPSQFIISSSIERYCFFEGIGACAAPVSGAAQAAFTSW